MKAMIKYIGIGLIGPMLWSCGQENKETDKGDFAINDSKTEMSASLEKPIKNYLEKAQLQEAIDKEIESTLKLSNDKLVIDAAAVIEETKAAMKAIADSSYVDAKKHIETGIGKAEAIVALNPELAFAPLDVSIGMNDVVGDVQTIGLITEKAEDALDDGKVQIARELLQGLQSELNIREYKLPIATYPAALKQALVLAKEEKYTEAVVFLNSALNTIVVEEKTVPLPLLRAERMLQEIESLVQEDNFKKEDVQTLLDNADYQINFAEALGYGKKDKEFKELHEAIEELEEQMLDDTNTDEQGLVKKLRSKLKKFKDRIS
ncbi:MAG: YfdX family protein [Saonia sp.]